MDDYGPGSIFSPILFPAVFIALTQTQTFCSWACKPFFFYYTTSFNVTRRRERSITYIIISRTAAVCVFLHNICLQDEKAPQTWLCLTERPFTAARVNDMMCAAATRVSLPASTWPLCPCPHLSSCGVRKLTYGCFYLFSPHLCIS